MLGLTTKELVWTGENVLTAEMIYSSTDGHSATNDAYSVAKIAGVKMCQSYNEQYKTNFICVVPASLFGPNDNFDLNDSHFVPAFIRKFHEAKIKEDKRLFGAEIREEEEKKAQDIINSSILEDTSSSSA